MAEHARAESAGAKVAGRVVVYALLTLVAAYYLLPLFVMSRLLMPATRRDNQSR